MSELLRPITALLLSAAILLMGNGLLTVLVPIRADIDGFGDFNIGIIGAAYYCGLLVGCLLCPRVVASVGHVRSFAAFTAIFTLAPLVQAIFPVSVVWWGLRFLTGICFAGLTMVIESWLNGASSNATRGSVLSIYTVINLTVVAAGQMLISLGNPGDFQLFSLVAVLVSLAAVPVALSRAVAPRPPQIARLRLAWLYRISPVALGGCMVTGLTNGAFWSLGPVFAARAGLSSTSIALFISAGVIGGALIQWPAGYASDRIDRRRVILVGSVLAVAAGLLLFFSFGTPLPTMLLLGFLYGGAAIPIYAVSVAHANDFTDRDDAVDVSSGLLLSYSVGAVVGPLIASAAMSQWGASTLFLYTAVVHVLFTAFVALRIRERVAPPPAEREEFVALPRTSQAVFGLDPRMGEAEADAAAGPPKAG